MRRLYPLFLTAAGLACGLSLGAQTVITLEDYPREAAFEDTTYRAPYPDSAIVLEEGQDLTWDFSDLTYDTSRVLFSWSDARGNDTFPDAYQSIRSTFTFQNFVREGRSYYGFDSTGLYQTGYTVNTGRFPLTALTGVNTDSLIILGDTVDYTSDPYDVRFPLAFGTSWQDTVITRADYILTASPFGVTNVPGSQQSVSITHSSVVGSGTLIVANGTGGVDTIRDVLLVKNEQSLADSFFLGGAPAPAALQQAFGIQQGVPTRSTAYRFHVPGMYASALNVSPQCRCITYRPRAGDLISSVPRQVRPPVVRYYPNPAPAGSAVTVEAKEALGRGMVDLTDLSGRTVYRQPYRAGLSNLLTIDLPAELTGGQYVFYLRGDRGRLLGVGRLRVR
jgi:hypothetical protein